MKKANQSGPILKPTMHDIARESGVAIGTVSNVLNGLESVRPKIKERVTRAITKLGYEPNQAARALRRNRSDIIGMVIPDITNPFFPLVVRGAEDAAYKKGLRLILGNSDEDAEKEIKYVNDLLQYNPTCLILIPGSRSVLDAGILANSRCPTVCIDKRIKGWKGVLVASANEEGGYRATRYLLSMGHKRIAIISGANTGVSLDRSDGYKRALEEEGIDQNREYLMEEDRFDRPAGYRATLALLQTKNPPTAIFAENDLMAIGSIEAIREMGLKCPQDISVVGFDNLDVCEMIEPALTTISQSPYDIGAKAVEVALHILEQNFTGAENVVLPVNLILRNSVRRWLPL